MPSRRKNFNRKSMRRKSIRRQNKRRQSIRRQNKRNKTLKKYGGTQTHISVFYYGKNFSQLIDDYPVTTTIGDLIISKGQFYLYHHGKLLSKHYKLDDIVFDVLPEDGKRGHYGIEVIKKPKAVEGEELPEPSETIIESQPKEHRYLEDPNDYYSDDDY